MRDVSPVSVSLPQRRPWGAMLLVIILSALSLWQGLNLRAWTWRETHSIHFTSDIQRGYRYGRRAVLEGYFDLYDKVLTDTRGRYLELDYAPLRLGVMTTWAKLIEQDTDLPQDWERDADFNWPILHLNTAMEVVGALGIFLLVRHWRRRHALAEMTLGTSSPRSPPALPPDAARSTWRPGWDGWIIPFLGALLFWFSPAIIASAHGWPTWDMWVIPFFIWSLYLACIGQWLLAGMVLGFGSLFKGQQLLVAPLFVLWPIFLGRPGHAVRWVVGFILAVGMVGCLWFFRHAPDPQRLMITSAYEQWIRHEGNALNPLQVERVTFPPVRAAGEAVWNFAALLWVGSITLGFGLLALARMIFGWRWWRWLLTGLLTLLGAGIIIGGWMQALPLPRIALEHSLVWQPTFWTGLLAAGWVVITVWALPRRWWLTAWAGLVALAIWLCVPLFHPSMGWLQIGWAYGEHHWQFMMVGYCDNIPGLLNKRFGWHNETALMQPWFTIPAFKLWLWPRSDLTLTAKQVFAAVYFTLLVFCSWRAARYFKVHDKRFLIAAILPWVIMFLVLGQMHERYLIFAAGAGACWIAVNWRMALINIALTLLTFKMTFFVMLNSSLNHWWVDGEAGMLTRDTAGHWRDILAATHPDMAWGLLVLTAVLLCVIVGKRRMPGLTPSPSGRGPG